MHGWCLTSNHQEQMVNIFLPAGKKFFRMQEQPSFLRSMLRAFASQSSSSAAWPVRGIWRQVHSLKQVCGQVMKYVQGEAEARGVPVSRVGSRSKAPVRPVSSSTVKRHSRGGSGYSGQAGRSSRASAVATPMPLSAPSVVPSAYTGVPA